MKGLGEPTARGIGHGVPALRRYCTVGAELTADMASSLADARGNPTANDHASVGARVRNVASVSR